MTNLSRTTITLPRSLLKRAKIAAIEADKTLSQLVRESLEEAILGKSTGNKMVNRSGEIKLKKTERDGSTT